MVGNAVNLVALTMNRTVYSDNITIMTHRFPDPTALTERRLSDTVRCIVFVAIEKGDGFV